MKETTSDIAEAVYDFQKVYLHFAELETGSFDLTKQHLESLIVQGSKFLIMLSYRGGEEMQDDLRLSIQYAHHILTEYRITPPENWNIEKFKILQSLVLQFFEDVFLSRKLEAAFSRPALDTSA